MDLQCLLVGLCANIWLKIFLTVQFTGPARHFHFNWRVLLFGGFGLCVCLCVHECASAWEHADKRFKERASNCSEMSQKGGLVRGYKPVVGVRAFLAEDQTGGCTTAKSDAVFFPHSAFPYHCCSTMAAAHALGYSTEVQRNEMCFNCWAATHMKKHKRRRIMGVGQWLSCTYARGPYGEWRVSLQLHKTLIKGGTCGLGLCVVCTHEWQKHSLARVETCLAQNWQDKWHVCQCLFASQALRGISMRQKSWVLFAHQQVEPSWFLSFPA